MKIKIKNDPGRSKNKVRDKVIHVRVDNETQHLSDIAGRSLKMSQSSFVDLALQEKLASMNVCPPDSEEQSSISFKDLWHVDEVIRFFKLVENAPWLLTDEEKCLWDFIFNESCFWKCESDGTHRLPIIELIRLLWDELLKFSETGIFNYKMLREKEELFNEFIPDVKQVKLSALLNAWEEYWAIQDALTAEEPKPKRNPPTEFHLATQEGQDKFKQELDKLSNPIVEDD